MILETVSVISHETMLGGYRKLTLQAPALAPLVQPGQFVHLRVPRLNDCVLRRPFSIYRAEHGQLALLYKTVGKGTRAMEDLRAGETVNLLGPLGNGFPAVAATTQPLLVAGGYGMAALYLVAQRSPVRGIVFVGGASRRDVLCVEDFQALNWDVRIATEDGSAGTKGLVTVLLDDWLNNSPATATSPVMYACGPLGMLKAVGQRAVARNRTAWLSMDRHMGCGVGACLACVQKVRVPDTEPAQWKWARICTEGPVFESRDIVWE